MRGRRLTRAAAVQDDASCCSFYGILPYQIILVRGGYIDGANEMIRLSAFTQAQGADAILSLLHEI
jgi:hypothetical protein